MFKWLKRLLSPSRRHIDYDNLKKEPYLKSSTVVDENWLLCRRFYSRLNISTYNLYNRHYHFFCSKQWFPYIDPKGFKDGYVLVIRAKDFAKNYMHENGTFLLDVWAYDALPFNNGTAKVQFIKYGIYNTVLPNGEIQ